MSIIHDALKKVQNKLNTSDEAQPPEENKAEEPSIIHQAQSPKPEKKLDYIKLSLFLLPFIIGILSIIVGIYIASVFKNKTPVEKQIVAVESKEEPATTPSVKAEPTPEASSIQNTVDSTEESGLPFVLNGTMMMGDKRAALINGEIYEIGETINGMKLINISIKQVELEADGQIIRLDVRKRK